MSKLTATLEGRIANIETVERPGGKNYIKASIAHEKRENKNGTWETTDTTWIDVCFIKPELQEYVYGNLAKGSIVSVTGALAVGAYIATKDGKAKPSVKIFADEVHIQEKKQYNKPQQTNQSRVPF